MKWSDKEISYLENNYDQFSAVELSNILKRTQSAITNKIYALNLSKNYDLTGKKSGKLTAVKPTNERINNKVMWECICDCGEKTVVSYSNFSNKAIRSCGCLRGRCMKDISTKTFGRLKVIECTGKTNSSGHLIWVCECSCGNQKEIPSDSLLSGKTTSCGCYQKEKAREVLEKHYHTFKLPTGKDHYNYNPNLTQGDRINRRSLPQYSRWRTKIYVRDEYTCKTCGLKKRNLNAHHLDGWNWATNKRFDLNNGITLCEQCHKEFHNIYGRGNNTKEQFMEFNKLRQKENV